MMTAIVALGVGIALLVWSADRFVEGSASVARHYGMPPLLIGMVIVGFGTSTPELVVSLFAAIGGNAGIAIGNAYGSNIANIALILGLSSLIRPIHVHSNVLRKELPILTAITLLSLALLADLAISRWDGIILLMVFGVLMWWTIVQGTRNGKDSLAGEIETETRRLGMPVKRAAVWLVVGLVFLLLSSRILVWGAVELASMFGVSDMIIGLTVVAVGTSLPELASTVIAARKGEHDIAVGNVIGSNLFNSLAVVGIAATIRPVSVHRLTISRDMALIVALTVSLFVIGYGFRGRKGRINRAEGAGLLLAYVIYTASLIGSSLR